MGTIRSLYTNNQPVTISMDSLPDGSTAISDTINNSTHLFLTADFQLKYTTTVSTTPLGLVELLIIRSADGGATFDDADLNAESIGSFAANEDATTFTVSTDTALSGQLGDYFKVAVKNGSGAIFDANPANFSLKYLGKQYEMV